MLKSKPLTKAGYLRIIEHILIWEISWNLRPPCKKRRFWEIGAGNKPAAPWSSPGASAGKRQKFTAPRPVVVSHLWPLQSGPDLK